MARINEATARPAPPPRDRTQGPATGFVQRVDDLTRLLRRQIVRLAIAIAILAGLHVATSIPLHFLSKTEANAPAGPLAQQLQDGWTKTQLNKEAIYGALRENGTFQRDKRTVDARVDAWQRHFFDPLYAFVMHENADATWYQAVLRIIGGIDIGPDSWVRFRKTQIVVPWGPHDEHLRLSNGMTLKAFTEVIGEDWDTPHFYSTWFGDGGADQMFGTGLSNDAALWMRASELSGRDFTGPTAHPRNRKR